MNELPPGWTLATADQIAACERNALAIGPFGSNLKVSDYCSSGVPLVFVRNIRARAFESADLRFVSPEKAESLRAHQVRHGDLLITKMGDPPGDAAIYPLMEPGIITADCIKLTPHPLIDVRYLLYAISAPEIRHQISEITQGVAQRKVSLDRFRKRIAIPLAPWAEQRRIVAAIEEQFSRLDAGVAALERVRQNFKRIRAAVLQSAVTDALKSTDRRVTQIAELLSAPLANGKSVPDGSEDGFPVLRLTAVRDGWIDVTCSKKGAWTATEARPYMIQKGDYLVIRGNGSKHLVGRGAMVREDARVAFPDTLIRLRFHDDEILPRYAALMWDSTMVRSQIEKVARTSAGIYKINQKDLSSIAFPVPSIVGQARICAWVEGILYTVQVLEAQLNSQFQRSNALRSSILADAFSGKLTVQDAGDEPASSLLQRITAESASSGDNRTKRGRERRVSRKGVRA